jgi:hypothetical protein
MPTMQEIEKLMERFGALRDALAGAALAQDEEIAECEKRHAPRLRRLTKDFQAAHEAVVDAVRAAPDLFAQKRSVVLHGIRAGWQKGKGALEWDDDADVVARIERHFADQADELIRVSKKPVRAALNELSTHDLRRLGITVEETGDEPFARLAEKEAARLIRALLRKAAKDEDEG